MSMATKSRVTAAPGTANGIQNVQGRAFDFEGMLEGERPRSMCVIDIDMATSVAPPAAQPAFARMLHAMPAPRFWRQRQFEYVQT